MEFISEDGLLILKRSTYTSNGATYLGLFLENGEPYVDVTVNTPFNGINTIVLSSDFINLCPKDLVDRVVEEVTNGKISDIQMAYTTLPKYWLKMEKLEEIEDIG